MWTEEARFQCRYTFKKGFMYSEVHKMRATEIGELEVQFVERRGWKTTTKLLVVKSEMVKESSF